MVLVYRVHFILQSATVTIATAVCAVFAVALAANDPRHGHFAHGLRLAVVNLLKANGEGDGYLDLISGEPFAVSFLQCQGINVRKQTLGKRFERVVNFCLVLFHGVLPKLCCAFE